MQVWLGIFYSEVE